MNVATMIPQNQGTTQGWRVSQQGGTFRIQAPMDEKPEPLRCTKRGRVSGYSRGSAQRLRFLLNSILHVAYVGGLHLTLTFSDDTYPDDYQGAKDHLDRFLKWLDRHLLGVPVAWRQEFGEKNGRVHFHLLIFATTWLDPVTIGKAWGNGFVKVRYYESAKLWRYISKYVGKAETEEEPEPGECDQASPASADASPGSVDLTPAHISPQPGIKWKYTGRAWGIRNRKRLVFAPLECYPISQGDSIERLTVSKLRRTMRRWKKADRWERVKTLQAKIIQNLDEREARTGVSFCGEWRPLQHENIQAWSKRLIDRYSAMATRLKKHPSDIVGKSTWRCLHPSPTPRWLAVRDFTRFSILVPQHFDVVGLYQAMYWETVADLTETYGTIEQGLQAARLVGTKLTSA